MTPRTPERRQGVVAPGFEAVGAEFRRLVEQAPGAGAAFAAVRDGEIVVDVRGGGWEPDTAALLFSGTKGVVSVCILRLLERGDLDLDAPLVRYWPEFGREKVLVRHVLSHTAGLPGLRTPASPVELLDSRHMAERVAAEPLYWPPGSRLAYHALTWGWLCGELVRRSDGRSVGTLLAEDIARPLELDLWLGLPDGLEPRVATLTPADDYGVTFLGNEPEPLLDDLYCGLLGRFPWNDRGTWRAEIPAVNAIGTARAMARLYGSLVASETTLLAPETVVLGRQELSRGVCAVTRRPYAFGVGFELQAASALGPPADAFGHTGSGGSSHGAWPSDRVGFSFIPGELWPEARDDRARRLLGALHAAVSGEMEHQASG